MDNILVLDGNQRSALAVVRSLGMHGLNITIGENKHPCLASKCRYADKLFTYASPLMYPDEFINSLKREIRNKKYAMIIPMTDITCYLIEEHRTELSEYAEIPLVDQKTYLKASEKYEVLNLSKSLGLPCPVTYLAEGADDIKDIGIDYPVVIKPRRSKYFTDQGWVNTSVEYAFSLGELRSKLNSQNKNIPLPVIQERITGTGEGAFALYCHGQIKALFFHKRIREKPPSGGVSVLRESIAVDPVIKEYTEKLLNALNWHGVAMVEFKRDEKDNLPKIMEINTRFWGSLQLAIDAGIDFPYMLYKMTMEGDVAPQFDYKVGVQSRWLWGDIDHLLARLFKSDAALNLPKNQPGRLKTFWEFMKFYKPNMKYEINRLNDFGPFLYESAEWFKHALRIGN